VVLLAYARACPAAFLPHLEALAGRATELWDAGLLRPGERNALSEGLLAASAAGPPAVQTSVVEWALAPVRAAWAAPVWQAALASPQAFIAHYMPVEADPGALGLAGVGVGIQVTGAASRWALYHQVHLLERVVRRAPGGGAPLAPHMAWALPSLLRLVANMNAAHSPAGRAALGAAAPALEMSPQERASYVRAGPAGRRAPAAPGADDDSGDYATVGGTTLSSLRAWMRHIREFTHHTIGMLPAAVPAALDLEAARAALAPSVLAFADTLAHHNLRLALRHVTIPHVRTLPARHLEGWALPSLALLAPHMAARLDAAWAGLAPVGPGTEDAAGAEEEIVREKMVRELTQEYAELLREVAVRPLEDPAAAAAAGAAPPTAAPARSAPAARAPTLLQLLLEREPAAGIAAATAAVQGMQRADESGFRFATVCRALVALAPRDAQLYAYVGSEVLRAAVSSLALESMATHQADILGLVRAVLAQQLGDPGSAAHGVLRSLPGMTPEREAAFGAAFLATGSEKEQRNAIKRMLVEACGRGSFAALADWRPPSAPALGAAKPRVLHAGSNRHPGSREEEERLQGV
jgi:exportin-5